MRVTHSIGLVARVTRYLAYCVLLVAKPVVFVAGAFGSRLCYLVAIVTLFARLVGAGSWGVVISLIVAGLLCSVVMAAYDHLLAVVLPPARTAATEG